MKKLALLLTIIVLTACQVQTDTVQIIDIEGKCHIEVIGDTRVKMDCLRNGAVPLPTSAASVTPTGTPAPSATATVAAPTTTPVKGTNLFKDPGFEGPYIDRPNIDGYNHTTPRDWNPFYCDGCQAYRIGTGNPTGLLLGRPEYKPASQDQDPLRIHSGKGAAEWFGFYRAIDGGLFQVVDTVPGASCTVSVYVQSWSGFDGDRDPHQSHLVTDDDKANSTWFVLVDLSGGSRPYRGDLLSSRAFGYDDSIYDAWAKIDFTFVTTGTKTTVFFDNMRLWPARNNNNYLDDASMVCDTSSNPTQAPPATVTPTAPSTPVATPTATTGPGPTPTQIADLCAAYPCYLLADNALYKVVTAGLNVRKDFSLAAAVVDSFAFGREVSVKCIVAPKPPAVSLEQWGSDKPCDPKPTRWFLLRDDLIKPLEGPNGE